MVNSDHRALAINDIIYYSTAYEGSFPEGAVTVADRNGNNAYTVYSLYCEPEAEYGHAWGTYDDGWVDYLAFDNGDYAEELGTNNSIFTINTTYEEVADFRVWLRSNAMLLS